jgi:hypothetical protein
MKWRGIILAITVAWAIMANGQEKASQVVSHQSQPGAVGDQSAPPPQVVCVVNQPSSGPESNRAEKQVPTYFQRLFSAENLPTIALIFVGIGGIWVAVVTLNHLRESSEQQLRAYVVTENGSIVNVADPLPVEGEYKPTEARLTNPQWGPVARVQIKNTGQTPAYDLYHWGSICFREYPLTSILPPTPPPDKYRSILGPGITIQKTLFFGPPLTVEQVQQLRDGTGAIYFHGEIVYRDAFNQKHHTRYRLMHNKMGGAVGINTDFNFAEDGNEGN